MAFSKANANSSDSEKRSFTAKVRLTLITDEKERFYGPGVQDLLAGIEKCGSVKDACRDMDLSYSKGRRILKHAEAVLGYPLVVRQQGGANGGSAVLTEEAEDFMARYEKAAASVSAYAQKQVALLFGDTCPASSSDV